MNRVLGVLLAMGALGLESHAQPLQPVYLQYDGFVRNKDARTITLSFGYDNMNRSAIRIPIGDSNTFLPSPPDRYQPLTLLEGRHRFACAVVVPDDFQGHLQWRIRFGGRTVTTTDKVLDPIYELDAPSERRVMAGLDLKSAPRGVCVNRAPSIQITGTAVEPFAIGDASTAVNMTGRVGTDLSLSADVQDDGLPRDGKVQVSWKKTRGPGGVVFSNQDAGATRAGFNAPGDYELELSASDGDKASAVKVRVTVSAAALTGGG